MDVRLDGRTERWTGRQTKSERRAKGWMDGRADKRMDERKNERIDERTDGRTEETNETWQKVDLHVIPVPVRPFPKRHDLPQHDTVTPHVAGRIKCPVTQGFRCRPADRDLPALSRKHKRYSWSQALVSQVDTAERCIYSTSVDQRLSPCKSERWGEISSWVQALFS